MTDSKRKILLVTGLSGAGLATTLKALEDLGYEAIDNLPLALVETLLEKHSGPAVALGIDSRTHDFSLSALETLFSRLKKNPDYDTRLLFMECSDALLQQRFTETRRRHPLAADRPVADGIEQDRAQMAGLKSFADVVVDTSNFSIHDLRRVIAGHFQLQQGHGLFVFVTSFSFKQGVPREADLVFDVRCLDNPHYDPKLRPLTGMDAPVAAKVSSDTIYEEFFGKLTGLLETLLPRYDHEGKSYLTIAIGCTGGRHRSVFVAEELFKWLDTQHISIGIAHRDLKEEKPKQDNTKEDKQRGAA